MAYRPYLFFGGTCRQAFTRYQEVFGGELSLMTMEQAPDQEPPPEMADLVIHASLAVGDDVLMGWDDPTTSEPGPVQGMMVTYDAADVGDAERVFAALAEGGTVTEALQPTFSSTAFGTVVDRFGTPWMVVAPEPARTG